MFKKKKSEEIAAAEAVETPREEKTEDNAEPAKKRVRISDIVSTSKDIYSTAKDFYDAWIKPVHDNWPQIKKRVNALVTVISVIFFIIYIPLLIFTRISKDLSLGWDVALYCCIGIYVFTLGTLLIVGIASGKSESTSRAKKLRHAETWILFIVRLASLAMAITAIIISGKGESQAVDVIILVLAIVSLVFTSLSLIFGGFIGLFKWLISPAKIRRKFSYVAFEWKQAIDDGLREHDKATKKSFLKNRERIEVCMDKYLLPAMGKAYIDAVNADKLVYVLGTVADEDKNITEWIIKDIFAYAEGCGYVHTNPCADLALEGDLYVEGGAEPKREGGGIFGKIASLFSRGDGDK